MAEEMIDGRNLMRVDPKGNSSGKFAADRHAGLLHPHAVERPNAHRQHVELLSVGIDPRNGAVTLLAFTK